MGHQSGLGRFLKKAYGIMFYVLLMDRLDTVPAGLFSALRRLKYVYLVLLLLFFLSAVFKSGFKKREGIAVCVVLILLLHTLLWGRIFVNYKLVTDTRIHLRELLLLLLFISGTAFLYSREGSVDEFAKHSYFAYFLSLLWAGLTHITHFVNPVKFVYVLGGAHSFRVDFGMGHANYVGSICCCALICSIFLFEKIRNHGSLKKALRNRKIKRLIISDIYIGEMLFSTASRTAILACASAVIIYILICADELFPSNGMGSARLIIIILGTIVVLYLLVEGFFNELLSESHRDSLLSTNYDIMINNFSLWTGMGYINYSGFAFGIWAYGFETANADSYYAYIFFATGVLGASIIGLGLVITTITVIIRSYFQKNICGVMTVVSFLFIGAAQASILSYDHLISYTYWIILLLVMSNSVGLQIQKTNVNGLYEGQYLYR